MKRKHGTIIRVICILLIVIMLFPTIPVIVRLISNYQKISVYPNSSNDGFKATELEKSLSMEGCFYDKETNSYVFPGLKFGCGGEEMISLLVLDEWYTEWRKESLLNDLKFRDVGGSVGNNITMNAFGAIYNIAYGVSQDGLCCYIELNAGILAVDDDTRGVFTENNVMSYDEACQYVYDLFDRFIKEYGEPSESDFSTDFWVAFQSASERALQNPSVSAEWISDDVSNRSKLKLSARTWLSEDDDGNDISYVAVCIAVGQVIENVTFEDLEFWMG